MNYYQAHNLLDEVREGAQYSQAMINKALELTGDYGFARLEKKNRGLVCPSSDAEGLGGVCQTSGVGDGERQIGTMGWSVCRSQTKN